MEAQRSDFRKGKTCFELESIFVYSASPLSDVNVALDNQDHRAGRVRRCCVPEEFNIVVGAVQGNTGPKKPNLTTSVPSGGTAMLK
ncbi:hypothetical protein BLNAU_23372 [Blattamonas nauphoetae]|uniref:Uncharacterized protein n=1 Tax=Blattamonas nauphoetae TaxID=2049346 RepID=A0ABQ9WUJ6_9EUKA|nr:hypothetical protein BLNAU_23372 [Blattamonas nauphoetae]